MVGQGLTRWLQRSLTVCVGLFFATVALVFLLGLILPGHFEVQRTVKIDATPERIHPLIVDLERWREWTAWSEDDGDLVHEYSDSSAGVGAWHIWRGPDSRAGRIEITAADIERGVWYDMTFDLDPDPMRGALRYLPSKEGALLEWSLRGELMGPMERALGPVFAWRMGADFDASLSSLTEAALAAD